MSPHNKEKHNFGNRRTLSTGEASTHLVRVDSSQLVRIQHRRATEESELTDSLVKVPHPYVRRYPKLMEICAQTTIANASTKRHRVRRSLVSCFTTKLCALRVSRDQRSQVTSACIAPLDCSPTTAELNPGHQSNGQESFWHSFRKGRRQNPSQREGTGLLSLQDAVTFHQRTTHEGSRAS